MKEILWTRSNGTSISIKEMNEFHLRNAIKKLRAQGYCSAADQSLFDSAPPSDEEDAPGPTLVYSELLTALETEFTDRGLNA